MQDAPAGKEWGLVGHQIRPTPPYSAWPAFLHHQAGPFLPRSRPMSLASPPRAPAVQVGPVCGGWRLPTPATPQAPNPQAWLKEQGTKSPEATLGVTGGRWKGTEMHYQEVSHVRCSHFPSDPSAQPCTSCLSKGADLKLGLGLWAKLR